MRWLALLTLLAACQTQQSQRPDEDLAVAPEDLATPQGDLRGADLAGRDLSVPPGADLASSCPCGTGQRCVGSACVDVDYMQVRFGQSSSQIIDGGYGYQNLPIQNMACFYHPQSLPNAAPVATVGPCRAYQQVFVQDAGPPTPLFFGSAGTVTVSGGAQGGYGLAPTDAGTGCYYANPPYPSPLFVDGQTLKVTGGGGADFPAFTQSVGVAPAFSSISGSIQRGQPLTVSWGNADPGRQLFIQATVYRGDYSGAVSVICTVDDTGSYTIPASLTSLYPNESSPVSYIDLTRQHLGHQEPAGKNVAIDVVVMQFGNRAVSYSP